jgi:hypothetical protein
MLDVHPPHEKMHGFKDFLLHLLTITIGLLIALGLEGYDTHQIRLDFTMGDLKSASLENSSCDRSIGLHGI